MPIGLIAAVLRSGILSLLLQVAGAALTFLTTLVIAWLSDDRGFGVYSLVYTWISLLSMVAIWGGDDLVVKWVPIYTERGQTGHLRALLHRTVWRVGRVSLAASLFFLVLMFCLDGRGLSQYASFYYWALLSLPFFGWMHLLQAWLRAVGQTFWGQFADKVVQPLAFLAWLGLGYAWSGGRLDDGQVIVARWLAFVVAAGCAYWLWRNHRPAGPIPPNTEHAREWARSCRFFTATTLLYALNTRVDIILLGWFDTDPRQIAYYNVAVKFSDLLLLPFMGISAVVTPRFARLHAQDAKADLQKLYIKATRIGLTLTTLGAALFLLLGDWLLGWYGKAFGAGYPCLVWLCLAKVLHNAVGPANYLLSVAGQERAAMWAVALSTLLVVVLHSLLIPRYGIEGAAWATLSGGVLYELMMLAVVRKRLGMRAGPV